MFILNYVGTLSGNIFSEKYESLNLLYTRLSEMGAINVNVIYLRKDVNNKIEIAKTTHFRNDLECIEELSNLVTTTKYRLVVNTSHCAINTVYNTHKEAKKIQQACIEMFSINNSETWIETLTE